MLDTPSPYAPGTEGPEEQAFLPEATVPAVSRIFHTAIRAHVVEVGIVKSEHCFDQEPDTFF